MRALCLHGHFYQPPREHPWLGVVEPEASAAPERDWNTRITAECYAPNAAARILDARGRLADLVNTYAWTSFDFGPTLLAWLAGNAPGVIAALREADAASRARTGFGNAWAQAYAHPILPLCTPRDARTQVVWGRRDFEHRFGRAPDGMWLPEMAVDRLSLGALAEAGIGLTMLAAHQARRVRPLGTGPDAWRAVTPGTLDTRRLYRCVPAPGLTLDVVFRDGELSHGVAFADLLADGDTLARRVRATLADADDPALVTVAADGETYGHHHRFGEMALAWVLRELAADPTLTLLGPAAFRDRHPPTDEVEIAERTSWSCPHGVERWRADCGCAVATMSGWSQAWRTPLRVAIDWLRDELAVVYETRAGEVLRDPWGARDRYVECLLEPGRTAAFLTAEAAHPLSAAATRAARRVLELARHALFMQTSCGWFFDELTRIEPILVLRHAARALELAAALGARPEDGFVARLEAARSNLPARETGADLYRRAARGAAATPARVAASGALLALLGEEPSLPGYELTLSSAPRDGRLEASVRVVELATGAATTVPVVPASAPGALPACEAGGRSFTIPDLFGIQQEALMAMLARKAAGLARTAREELLGGRRPVLDALLEGGTPVPLEVATLLGWEQADAIVSALEANRPPATLVAATGALRRRGARFPVRWLGERLTRALEEQLGRLPDGADTALALLDLAAAADVPLDLGCAQVLALAWYRDRPPAGDDQALVALRERLALAPGETER